MALFRLTISFLLNNSKEGFAKEFRQSHKAGACGMGFAVNNPGKALEHCLNEGGCVKAMFTDDWHDFETKVICGIADTKLYLTGYDNILDSELFKLIPGRLETMQKAESGLLYIDHLTHNVFRGNMDKWAKFYKDLFNFRQIRYFDIEGKLTGLYSRAMTSPCLNIRIPINESADDKSQIEEFINDYNGEGVQHIALSTNNIYKTVEKLKNSGIIFMDTPATYYTLINERLPFHEESLEALKKNKILIDGSTGKGDGILLQIFTKTSIGPIFFEIIQRKGDEGFGEGNFKALFDSIELDQVNRGKLI